MEEIRWKYGNDVRYAYAMGVIRVLETRLLSKERIDRAADASDAEEVLRILGETPYSEYLSSLANPADYDSFLEEEHQKALDLLQRLTEDPILTDLFLHRFDFYNLKVALKEKFGAQELDSAYVSFGSIPVLALKSAVRDENFSALPKWLRYVAEQAIREFPDRQDPKWIDVFVDGRMYGYLVSTSRGEGSLFLHDLLQREIDLINILSLFRIRRSGGERGFFLESFIEDGSLPRRFFLQLFDEPLEALPGRFDHTPYREIVGDGWAYLNARGSFIVFERMGQDLILEYLRRANLIAFGVEPLIAYMHAKENELRMIRAIMVGKLNRLESTLIKESLPRVHL